MTHYKLISCNIPDNLLDFIPINNVKTYVDPIDKNVQSLLCKMLNIDVSQCSVYRIMLVYLPANHSIKIHSDKPIETKDPGKLDQAIFLPLKNCNTVTWNWYESTDDTKAYPVGSGSWQTVPMLPFEFAKTIDSIECTNPFIADIGTWHNLINTGSEPAIGISIRLMPWSWKTFATCNELPPMRGLTLL